MQHTPIVHILRNNGLTNVTAARRTMDTHTSMRLSQTVNEYNRYSVSHAITTRLGHHWHALRNFWNLVKHTVSSVIRSHHDVIMILGQNR